MDGHLNNPERIHLKEHTFDLHHDRWFGFRGIELKNPQIEKSKAELRGLQEYGKILFARIEEQKEANFKRIQEFKTKKQNLKWYNKIFN